MQCGGNPPARAAGKQNADTAVENPLANVLGTNRHRACIKGRFIHRTLEQRAIGVSGPVGVVECQQPIGPEFGRPGPGSGTQHVQLHQPRGHQPAGDAILAGKRCTRARFRKQHLPILVSAVRRLLHLDACQRRRGKRPAHRREQRLLGRRDISGHDGGSDVGRRRGIFGRSPRKPKLEIGGRCGRRLRTDEKFALGRSQCRELRVQPAGFVTTGPQDRHPDHRAVIAGPGGRRRFTGRERGQWRQQHSDGEGYKSLSECSFHRRETCGMPGGGIHSSSFSSASRVTFLTLPAVLAFFPFFPFLPASPRSGAM